MLTAHILMILIPGIVTPISTEQIFESKAACEIAKEALASTTTQSTVISVPQHQTPLRINNHCTIIVHTIHNYSLLSETSCHLKPYF